MQKVTKKSVNKKIIEQVEEVKINKKSKILDNSENKPQFIKNELPELLNGYVSSNTQFKIYFRNEILFDSKNKLKKEYPIFNQNDFIIGENKYIYRGIRIEIY